MSADEMKLRPATGMKLSEEVAAQAAQYDEETKLKPADDDTLEVIKKINVENEIDMIDNDYNNINDKILLDDIIDAKTEIKIDNNKQNKYKTTDECVSDGIIDDDKTAINYETELKFDDKSKSKCNVYCNNDNKYKYNISKINNEKYCINCVLIKILINKNADGKNMDGLLNSSASDNTIDEKLEFIEDIEDSIDIYIYQKMILSYEIFGPILKAG
eukprot:149714_1